MKEFMLFLWVYCIYTICVDSASPVKIYSNPLKFLTTSHHCVHCAHRSVLSLVVHLLSISLKKSLKLNQLYFTGGWNWHLSLLFSRHGCLPLFSRIIFAFTGNRTCLTSPFIKDEAWLRSAPFFSPLSLSVQLYRPRLAALERTQGKRTTWTGKHRCGPQCHRETDGSVQRGILCSEIGFPLDSLINKTSHPFALSPQAAHKQECATQEKSLQIYPYST